MAYCAVGTATGKLMLWEVGSGKLLAVLEKAHYRGVSALRFTDDGAFLLSGGDDAMVHVWRLSSLLRRM